MVESMSIKHRGITDWMKNKEWYYVDEERNRYVLTDKAPEEARRSFEKWKIINDVNQAWKERN